MNSITQAMRTAGVSTPSQMQRIWMWLNDHQPQSGRQIKLALKLPQTASLLSQMEVRRMVSSTIEHDRSTNRHTKRFNVIGKAYEMLPLPFKPAVAKPTAQVFAIQFPPIVAPETPEAVQCSQAGPTAFDPDTLTIAEARALYKRLAPMFQGEKA